MAPEATEMAPLWVNFFENPAMTQFVHRTFAYVVLIVAVIFALKARGSGHKASGFWATMLLLGVLAQAAYGIFTLMGLLGAVAASFLPETFRTELPDTINDIEKRPRYPYFSFKVWEATTVPTSEI